MADEDTVESDVSAEETLSAEKSREAKQLDAVTDYHEDGEIDTSKAQAVRTFTPAPPHALFSRAHHQHSPTAHLLLLVAA